MSDTSTGNGKVVVNRSMSLDGFIAGPGHAMGWVFDFVAPDEFPEIAAATGAMLVGRRTYEVGNRMDAGKERGSASSGETYPFSGPVFVLTHEPPDPPDAAVTFLTGDIGEAVAAALRAAGGKNRRSSAPTWPASACSEGSSTRSWCMYCRCCSATASASRPRASPG